MYEYVLRSMLGSIGAVFSPFSANPPRQTNAFLLKNKESIAMVNLHWSMNKKKHVGSPVV